MQSEIISNFSPSHSIHAFNSITGIPDSILDAAKAKLIQLLKEQDPDFDLDPNQVILDRFQLVTWSDASLGCPKEGQSYLQVLTPGYSIEWKIGCKHYRIHTDASGSSVASPDFLIQD
jgi:hypothetical protein